MGFDHVTTGADLAAFMLERIADDEQEARRTIDELRRLGPGAGTRVQTAALGEHVVRWSPERVLAECEAKRQLVEWALDLEYQREVDDPAAPLAPFGLDVLQLLAPAYSTHPGFRQDWLV